MPQRLPFISAMQDDHDDPVIHGIWSGFWQIQKHQSLVYVIAAGMGYTATPSDTVYHRTKTIDSVCVQSVTTEAR